MATYARKAEERCDQLLADFDSIPDDDIEQWHEAMLLFEDCSEVLPESFRQKRSRLTVLLFERFLKQLSPTERDALLRKLRSQ